MRCSLSIPAIVALLAGPACERLGGGAAPPPASAGKGGHDDAGQPAGEEHHDEVTLAADVIARSGIEVEPVARRVLVPTLRAPARVSFNEEAMAHVGSAVRGRVVELKARLGDDVAKGDELLVIESPELGEAQTDFLLKRAAEVAAEPAVDLAKNMLDRAKTLYDSSQGVSLTEVQKREAEHRAAKAAQISARTARLASENRLHLFGMSQEAVDRLAESGEIAPRFHVIAPIAGTVVKREVTLGELVDAEREALLVLADLKRLWVLADVPETRLHEIVVGGKVRVLLGSEQRHWCDGEITLISPMLDPATRSVRVRIEAKDRHPELRPGIFAQAELLLETDAAAKEPVLAIPDGAVQMVEGSASVFVPVEGEPGTFTPRAVEIGPPVGGWSAVRSGLAEGERFVARGAFLLKAELGKSSARHEH